MDLLINIIMLKLSPFALTVVGFVFVGIFLLIGIAAAIKSNKEDFYD